jgi:hypothetical protein
MMAEYLKETLRTANQAFEAGTRAADGGNTQKLATAIKALDAIANMTSDPNRASSEYRCQEAALCANNALTAIRGMK